MGNRVFATTHNRNVADFGNEGDLIMDARVATVGLSLVLNVYGVYVGINLQCSTPESIEICRLYCNAAMGVLCIDNDK